LVGADHRDLPPWLRYAGREKLTSAMNATKWREVVEVMTSLTSGPPRFRIKDLQGAEPGQWDREWVYHPRPWETIEWLEIAVDSSQESEVVSALRLIGVPFSRESGNLRILGWLRPV
jgi:hypothetical protein